MKSNHQLREQIMMIILSAIDLVAGILSIIFSQLAVQIIATLASGATLIKAVKVAKSAKTLHAEETIVKVAVKAIPAVAVMIAKCIHKKTKKETFTMKKFLQKLKTELKNNPVTIMTALFEAFCCGGGGYAVFRFLSRYSAQIPHPWNIVLTIALTLVVYVCLAIATIYLGHDNETFAAIRKVVKAVGGDEALGALNEVVADVEEKAKAQAEQERLIAERQARNEEIKARILAEEKKREDEVWERKIAAYLANHPELKEEAKQE